MINSKVPKGWKLKRLGDIISSVQNGFACGDRDEGGIIQLRMHNLNTRGQLIMDNCIRVPVSYYSDDYELKNGDILFNHTNSAELVGKSILFNGYAEVITFSNHFSRIRINGKIANANYILRCLQRLWQEKYFEQFCDRWIGQAAFQPKKLVEINIPHPPLPVQRRIAAIIDEKLAAVEKAKKAAVEQREGSIRLKSKLYDDVFQKYVDNIMTIDSICTDISDGTHFTPSYVPKGVPFLSVKDLSAGRISFDDCRYITMEEHNKLIKRCKPEYGDVLYTKVGTTGIAKEIDTKKEFSIFVSVALLKLKEGISAKYIEKALNIPYVKKQAEFYTQGATNKNLVIQDLKKIKLYCPNIGEQRKILERLDRIDNDCNELNNAIIEQQSYINALPAAILRKAFAGEM
jgi:type I restriction enzyme S subunit